MIKSLLSHFKRNLFRDLFVSMLGIVLLTSGILGVIMLDHSMAHLREKEKKLLESKLHAIVADFENQFDSMRLILADVGASQLFKWKTLKENKYSEISALSHMESYDKPNDIWDLCFVKYARYDNVLVSNKTVVPLDLHLKRLYGEKDISELMALIQRMYWYSEKRGKVYSDGKKTLFLFSTIRSGDEEQSKVVVCFQVTQEAIEKRIEHLVGKLGGEIIITYRGQILYGTNTKIESDSVSEFSTYDGELSVYYQNKELEYFSWKNIFSYKQLLIFGLSSCFFLVVIFILSVWNYRPIRNLIDKYILYESGNSKTELESIDKLIDNLQNNKEKNDQLILEQYRAIKEQFAFLVISGYNLAALKNHMTLLNIDYNNSLFGVASCGEIKEILNIDAFTTAISDLANNDLLLFPCYNRKIGLKVLIIVEEVYQFDEAIELINALFETMGLNILAKLSAMSSDIENWCCMTEKQTLADQEPIKINEKTKKIVIEVMDYVEEYFSEYDLSLTVLANRFAMNPAYLSRIIKQETGIGFKEYLMGVRIRKAKELLQNPEINVAEVCQNIGYANTSHFIKLFQKHTGMTPAKYRDKNCINRDRLSES